MYIIVRGASVLRKEKGVKNISQQKFEILLWFLKRPELYPHLVELIRRKIVRASARYPYLGDTQQEAESWCEKHAIDTSSAIRKITGFLVTESLQNKFKQIFVTAERKARMCPIEMGGAANLDLLYWIAEFLKAERVLETGIAYGWSSLAFLLSLQKRSGALLVSTDMPYPLLNNEQYVGCVVPAELKAHWQVITRPDRQAIPKALKELGSIDICHYDSDKSYEGRMWAYLRLWKALRFGGCFISDDIDDNLAFRDFSRAIGANPIVVKNQEKYVGILIKNNL